MIYALSRTRPSSSDVAANMIRHNINGQFLLDLTQTVADIPTASASSSGTVSATSSALALPTATGGSSNGQFDSIRYSPREMKFIAHGVLSALGFCFFLPLGVLLARFARIWWPRWFTAHWIVQAGLAGPFILSGFALAVSAVAEGGGSHFVDSHMVSQPLHCSGHLLILGLKENRAGLALALHLPSHLWICNPSREVTEPKEASYPKLWPCDRWVGLDCIGVVSSVDWLQ
jgi:hypothetical protein